MTVRCEGFRTTGGIARFALFASSQGFPEVRELAVRIDSAPVQGSRVDFELEALPPGHYAIAVLHDGNGNGRLDRNLLGIPRDGYGASLVRRYALRAPTFDESMFELGQHEWLTVPVKIHYML